LLDRDRSLLGNTDAAIKSTIVFAADPAELAPTPRLASLAEKTVRLDPQKIFLIDHGEEGVIVEIVSSMTKAYESAKAYGHWESPLPLCLLTRSREDHVRIQNLFLTCVIRGGTSETAIHKIFFQRPRTSRRMVGKPYLTGLGKSCPPAS